MADPNSLASAAENIQHGGDDTHHDSARALLRAEPKVFPLSECTDDNPAGLAHVRADLSEYLISLGVEEDKVEIAKLAISETIGNVERHSSGRVTSLAVRKGVGKLALIVGETGGEQAISLPDHASLPKDNKTAEGGRGLFLLEALGVEHWSQPAESSQPSSADGELATIEHWAVLAA